MIDCAALYCIMCIVLCLQGRERKSILLPSVMSQIMGEFNGKSHVIIEQYNRLLCVERIHIYSCCSSFYVLFMMGQYLDIILKGHNLRYLLLHFLTCHDFN